MMNWQVSPLFTAWEMVKADMATSFAASVNDHSEFVNDSRKSLIKNHIDYLSRQCAQLLLQACEHRFILLTRLFGRDFTYTELTLELKALLEAIEHDLQYECFYHYPKHKLRLLGQVHGEWVGALASFQSIRPEIDAGVDCYAIGHNTACIFHMMRIAELGLRALARERQVTFPNRPLEWAEWQNVVDEIESKAKSTVAGIPRGAGKDAAGSFYTAAVAQLRAFKETRNRVMHMRGSFDELDALRAINQVRDFMNGLSLKIGEKTRKPIRKWP